MTSSTPWSTPTDIARAARRRWDDGTLLRALVDEQPCPQIEVPLRGPRPAEIGDDLTAVRTWLSALDHGRDEDRRYALRWRTVGGRLVGRNELPSHAVVSTFDQAWALLGVRREVAALARVIGAAGDRAAVRDWAHSRPLAAVALGAEAEQVVAAYDWLDARRGSGLFLRQISAPGVDTKFVEQHRGVLGAMLGVRASAAGFLADLGLQAKPEVVRVRPHRSLGLPVALPDITVRADDLAALTLSPTSCLVVENEVTFLSVPVPESGLVIWGHGFEVDRVGRLPWLAGVPVTYWGDLDTHGFAILDRLRAWLPQTRSVLMDRDTLIEHCDRWGVEPKPTRAGLTRLTAGESEVYAELVADVHGERLRLEQERIDWTYALGALCSP
ncbi:hypothetical protein KLP28_13565 [Nocardioidaceae bacterium]|nr:hypothetical protein KLP28_13565 [Nocardioidaceae bacterium]